MKENFTTLDDFRNEYSYGRLFSWESPDGEEKYMGLEFLYKGHYYRFCKEPNRLFHVMEMITDKKSYPDCDSFRDIGWYKSMDELIENCSIHTERFKDVIVSRELVILSKD